MAKKSDLILKIYGLRYSKPAILAGMDYKGHLTKFLQTNVGGLRVAAKNGSSLLYLPENRFFGFKIISRNEIKEFRVMLATYRQHLEEHPDSLFCRIYGYFNFKNSLGYFLYIILINWLTNLPIWKKKIKQHNISISENHFYYNLI